MALDDLVNEGLHDSLIGHATAMRAKLTSRLRPGDAFNMIHSISRLRREDESLAELRLQLVTDLVVRRLG